MSRAWLVIALAVVVLAVAWGFGRLDPSRPETAPRVASRKSPVAVASTPPRATPEPAEIAADGAPSTRDLFAYADDEPRPAPIVIAPPPEPTPVATPEPLPVRFVGFVRRGASLRAALAVRGQVSLASVGESVDDVRVLALDEDRGVHVRLADGRETWLSPEPD